MRVNLVTIVLIFSVFEAIRTDDVKGSCSKIKTTPNKIKSPITLYWGSDPARAAATLFYTMVKRVLGYQNVELKKANHTLDLLRKQVEFNHENQYNDAILAVSTAWNPTDALIDWMPLNGQSLNIAGPRLNDYGASTVSARQRLHVHIANHLQNSLQCWSTATQYFFSPEWDFYADSNYTDCGFHNLTKSNHQKRLVYELDPENKIITKELTKRANSFSLDLEFVTINRTNLFQKLRTGNQSFLFIDYDIWEGDYDVRAVVLPPCIPEGQVACQEELDNAVSLRVGDIYYFVKEAPPIFNLAYNFTPTPEIIRNLLEQEKDGISIEDATCDFVLKNNYTNYSEFKILVFYCEDDYYVKDYDKVIELFKNESVKIFGMNIYPKQPKTYCSDKYDVRNTIDDYMKSAGGQKIIGAVVGNVNTSSTFVKDLDGHNLPVLVYDAVAIEEDLWSTVWFTNGRSVHLALALRDLFVNNTWNRIAVISEETPTAKALVRSLEKVRKKDGKNSFLFNNHPDFSPMNTKGVLKELETENARIILINTNYEYAFRILCGAVELGMNAADQYVWIVRDWRATNITLNITHFLISFSSQHKDDSLLSPLTALGEKPDLRRILNDWWSDNNWPPYIVPLADAILTLAHTFLEVIQKYPQARYDHGNEYIRQFEEIIVDASPFKGVTQNQTYRGHYLEKTMVLLNEWRGNKQVPLKVWSVNATTNSVHVTHTYQAYVDRTVPNDGTLWCRFSSPSTYIQTCHDNEVWIGLVSIILIPFLIFISYRFVRRHIKRREHKMIFKMMIGRQQRAAELSGYLIDRSLLEIQNVLGAGRFGCVHLAKLRRPGMPRKFVAAKSLRELRDEREILREACILASLDHPHIIRLVGICIDNEPTLMLMEIAFHADLLHYLQSRRYLIDNVLAESSMNQMNEEAFHVSAEALTKLAHQAASALGYLSLRGVIHRDLRAANCLVDAKRCLKLADFGMAREITAEEDGDMKYACKRRGLFPVPWMAPESLEHGVFSPASDMWALGVLVFELVTLGAHPYGNMSPLRVLQYVIKGGKPTMPRDVTPQTAGLARLCWQPDPEQRPSAAEVVAYLAERPSALRPALLHNDMPVAVDSGYGTIPEPETLLPR